MVSALKMASYINSVLHFISYLFYCVQTKCWECNTYFMISDPWVTAFKSWRLCSPHRPGVPNSWISRCRHEYCRRHELRRYPTLFLCRLCDVSTESYWELAWRAALPRKPTTPWALARRDCVSTEAGSGKRFSDPLMAASGGSPSRRHSLAPRAMLPM